MKSCRAAEVRCRKQPPGVEPRFTAACAISSAWLNPRARRLLVCRGTGTSNGRIVTTSRTSSRIASASMLPRGPATGVTLSYFSRWMRPRKTIFVFAERDRALKFGLEIAAVPATAIAHQQLRADQAISADNTLRRAHRPDRGQTLAAHRNSGNIFERSVTKPAFGRKQNAKNTAQKSLQRQGEDSTLLGARISSSSS